MATPQCTSRLQKELKSVIKEPLPHLRALPSPSSLLDWHYVLEGASDSDYAGGWYHGRIVFPPQYPFKPPSIVMLTPSGRFEAGSKICLSLSDFHPESWNPLWGVSHILLGLQSFFYENTSTTGALHGISPTEKRRLAKASLAFNVRNATFRKLFPELVEKHYEQEQAEAIAQAIRRPLENDRQQQQQRTGNQNNNNRHGNNNGGVDNNEGGGENGVQWRDVVMGVVVAVLGLGVAAVLTKAGTFLEYTSQDL